MTTQPSEHAVKAAKAALKGSGLEFANVWVTIGGNPEISAFDHEANKLAQLIQEHAIDPAVAEEQKCSRLENEAMKVQFKKREKAELAVKELVEALALGLNELARCQSLLIDSSSQTADVLGSLNVAIKKHQQQPKEIT